MEGLPWEQPVLNLGPRHLSMTMRCARRLRVVEPALVSSVARCLAGPAGWAWVQRMSRTAALWLFGAMQADDPPPHASVVRRAAATGRMDFLRAYHAQFPFNRADVRWVMSVACAAAAGAQAAVLQWIVTVTPLHGYDMVATPRLRPVEWACRAHDNRGAHERLAMWLLQRTPEPLGLASLGFVWRGGLLIRTLVATSPPVQVQATGRACPACAGPTYGPRGPAWTVVTGRPGTGDEAAAPQGPRDRVCRRCGVLALECRRCREFCRFVGTTERGHCGQLHWCDVPRSASRGGLEFRCDHCTSKYVTHAHVASA